MTLHLFGAAQDSAWIPAYRNELRSLPGISLVLRKYSHSEKILSTLGGSNNIYSVHLRNTKITEEMVRSLATQQNLTLLCLMDCEEFEGKLKLLEPLKQLDRLVLFRTSISQEDFDALQKFSALTALGIESSLVTSQSVETMFRCPTLKRLAILNSTDQAVTTMALKPWPGIIYFYCKHVTPQCIPDLTRMTHSKEIHVFGSTIIASDTEHAEVSLPNVRLRAAVKLPE